jgi:hypothetical protein
MLFPITTPTPFCRHSRMVLIPRRCCDTDTIILVALLTIRRCCSLQLRDVSVRSDRAMANRPPLIKPTELTPDLSVKSCREPHAHRSRRFAKVEAQRHSPLFPSQSAGCHGAKLHGGMAPALVGKQFWLTYGGGSCCGQVGELSWSFVRGSFVHSARFLETGGQAASP